MVTSLHYGLSRLEINLIGHPTQALEKARVITQLVFGNTRWRFEEIRYVPPNAKEHADRGSLRVVSRKIPV